MKEIMYVARYPVIKKRPVDLANQSFLECKNSAIAWLEETP